MSLDAGAPGVRLACQRRGRLQVRITAGTGHKAMLKLVDVKIRGSGAFSEGILSMPIEHGPKASPKSTEVQPEDAVRAGPAVMRGRQTQVPNGQTGWCGRG